MILKLYRKLKRLERIRGEIEVTEQDLLDNGLVKKSDIEYTYITDEEYAKLQDDNLPVSTPAKARAD